MTTNAELKTIREYLSVSTEWLAKQMGISMQGLWKYERASRETPVPEHVAAVLRELLNDRACAIERATLEYANPHGPMELPRFVDGDEWRAAFPEFAGWPDSAQGSFLGELLTRAGARIEFVGAASGG